MLDLAKQNRVVEGSKSLTFVLFPRHRLSTLDVRPAFLRELLAENPLRALTPFKTEHITPRCSGSRYAFCIERRGETIVALGRGALVGHLPPFAMRVVWPIRATAAHR